MSEPVLLTFTRVVNELNQYFLLFSRVFSFGTRLRILLLAVQTVNIFAPWGKREDDPQQRRRAEGEAAKAKVLTFKALN